MPVFEGRYGGRIEGDFVVFVIGMRINRPLKVHRWLPVFVAMPRMIRELEQDPESGFLGATQGLMTTGPALVQYWRSFEHLERFAKDDADPHLKVWRTYWKRVGKDPRSGIWHETFLVRAGEYEAIYGNMPPYGLGRAGDLVPLREDATARRRLKNLAT